MGKKNTKITFKDCPFCGGSKIEFSSHKSVGFWCLCPECSATSGEAKNKKDAGDKWNKRVDTS